MATQTTALPASYLALHAALSGDAPFVAWLASGSEPVSAAPRVWNGEAPKGTPLSTLVIARPYEVPDDTYETPGNEGSIRMALNTPIAWRHLAGATGAQHVIRILGAPAFAIAGHAILDSWIEVMDSFREPDGLSYRTIMDWHFETMKETP